MNLWVLGRIFGEDHCFVVLKGNLLGVNRRLTFLGHNKEQGGKR